MLRTEPIDKWVRGRLDGEVVVESRETLLVWQGMFPPVYAFRRDEIAESSSASTMGLIGGTSMGYAYARARDGVALERVHDTVLEEVERIVADGVTELELRRAKAQFERHWLHELARIDSRADAFGEYATLHGDPALVNHRLDKIDAVDLEAVAAALAAALDPAHRSTLIYRKENA